MGKLEGKVALVTGGGTGIGKATSLLFAGEGADVAVNFSRSRSDAEDTVSEIRQLGSQAIAVCADISNDDAVRLMIGKVVKTLGRLDILVNNAATTRFVLPRDLEGMTEELWDKIFDVNVKGTFFCSRAAIAAMRLHDGGHIVNVSSDSAFTGRGSSIAYTASKAAIINMTLALAISQAPEIRVNAVAPGVVETRWIDKIRPLADAARRKNPLQRLARPNDIAEAILGLVVNDFITGHTLVVNGGATLV
ncbi:MAG: SDR family oxidoreductase [Acidobacteriota bacterium]|nr:SDR family oxidoreductase [Acidobacteriota bacterium]